MIVLTSIRTDYRQKALGTYKYKRKEMKSLLIAVLVVDIM